MYTFNNTHPPDPPTKNSTNIWGVFFLASISGAAIAVGTIVAWGLKAIFRGRGLQAKNLELEKQVARLGRHTPFCIHLHQKAEF